MHDGGEHLELRFWREKRGEYSEAWILLDGLA